MSSAAIINSEPKLQVLQTGSTAYPGDVTNAIKTSCISLRRLGHEVPRFTDGRDLDELEVNDVACHVTVLWQHPKMLYQSSWQLRNILKSYHPEVFHVHGSAKALRCVLARRSADWFTLNTTQLAHQVVYYDPGLIRKYLSPWVRNFFVLDQLVGDIYREFGCAPNRSYKSDMVLIASASAHRRANARERFGVAPDENLCSICGSLTSNQTATRSCRTPRLAQRRRNNLTSNLL